MKAPAGNLVATAIVRNGEQLLLVRQRIDGYSEETWSLPGGVVEAGELAIEALAREVREETGVTSLHVDGLAYLIQLHRPARGDLWTILAFEARCGAEVPKPLDPDQQVTAAKFIPLAAARLQFEKRLPRVIAEPLISYLDGDSPPGAAWFYRESSVGVAEFVNVVYPAGKREVVCRHD